MKALLIIFAIYICHVICDVSTNKYAVKSFPKKVKPYGNGKIVINSGKYELRTKPKPIPTQVSPSQRVYTVFQVVGFSKMGVPDSPYFPGDQSFDHKTRVKKVLPDYAPWSSLRSKRSAVLDAPPAETNDKVETTTEKKAVRKAEKSVDKDATLPSESKPKNAEEEQMKKDEKKTASTVDKQTKETQETKKESKSTKDVDPENIKKKETPMDKQSDTELAKKDKPNQEKNSESKTIKEKVPKNDEKSEFRSNDKKDEPELKSDTKSDSKSNKSKELMRAREKPMRATSRSASNAKTNKARSKLKGKEVNAGVTTGKVRSKGKDERAANVRVKGKEKVRAKPKSKDTKVEEESNVKAKNGKETKAEDVNVNATNKDDKIIPKVTNIRNKKNNTSSGVNRQGKKQKRKGLPARAKKGEKPRSKNARSKNGLKTKPANETRPGKKLKVERRLIAAREALIEDYPYVVSIQKNDEHWCSGALLNPRLVITTANCLWKANRISRMEVRAGSRHIDRGGQMAGIQEVMKHPNWGLRKSPDNDVALVLLNKNIKFSDSCHAVDLPNRVMMPAFDDAWVTSWGAERRDGVYDKDSTSLQVYHTRLIEREKCNNITMRFSVLVTENFICLAQLGRTSPCTRDTGAPAVSDGVLWALASWGIRKLCGTERFPAVFSYLASHSNMDFIANATHFLMSDKRFYPFGDRFPAPKRAPSSSTSEQEREN